MKLKRIFSVLLCTVMIFSAVCVNAAGVYILKPLDQSNGEQMAEFYDAFLKYVMSEYRYDLTREELLEAAVKQVITDHPELFVEFAKGSFNALDENSMFYTQDEYMERFQDVAGVYVGIGINVFYDEDKVILGEALPGTPAEGSGLSIGDIVVAVDGERVDGYGLDKVTSLIKGEEGTNVDITVLRNGVEYTYTVARAVIKINPLTYEIIEGTNVGYVKLSSFNASSAEVFAATMTEFGKKGVKTIVLDLRNNVGGYLDAA
ncbi:MAG: PDZ domain-containing protein, partial [Clostridia bacterium]|nr:PDZ domain-containing protein [Clostridia bacterium]